MNINTARAERINMRTTQHEKSLLVKAAKIAGFSTLTNFILLIAKREAEHILENNNRSVLSGKDQAIIMELLQNPPKPNKRLCELINKK
jgi:uncharacterized protein (DUF1778 family)